MQNICIIWDWNGTLLDDVNIAIETRNDVFPTFNLSKVKDLNEYHDQFRFPIKDYYKKAGCSDELFDDVANAWMKKYNSIVSKAELRANTILVLEYFKKMGYKQIIVSASKIEYLIEQVKALDIQNYFDDILGLNDIYANSKLEIASKYVKSSNSSTSFILIGDTTHDYDVALEIGAIPILVAGGHQPINTLKSTGAYVVKSLYEIINLKDDKICLDLE